MRRYVNSKGKPIRLTTHDRIQEFKKYESLAGETLEVVKWIGTTRHMVKSSRWTTCWTVPDSLSNALKLLYDTSDDEVAKLVRKINKSKGLPRGRR